MPKRSSAFSIPMATAAKETSGRKTIITRVRRMVSSAFPGWSSNPGARSETIGQAKTIPSTTRTPSTTARRVSTRFARAKAACRPPSFCVRAYTGTKAAESAPSAKRSRRRLGIRKPIRNASEW